MSHPGLPANDDAAKQDFAAARAGSNYDWILNAGAAAPANPSAGGVPPRSQQSQAQGAPPVAPQPAAAAPPADTGSPKPAAPRESGFPLLPDPHAPLGLQLGQSFENVWTSMQAESGAAASQLRRDLWPKNLSELKANLMATGGDPIALLAKLGLDTGGYLFSPVTGAARQIAGAPVTAVTGSKAAGEFAGNAAAAAAGLALPGAEGEAAEQGLKNAAAEAAAGNFKFLDYSKEDRAADMHYSQWLTGKISAAEPGSPEIAELENELAAVRQNMASRNGTPSRGPIGSSQSDEAAAGSGTAGESVPPNAAQAGPETDAFEAFKAKIKAKEDATVAAGGDKNTVAIDGLPHSERDDSIDPTTGEKWDPDMPTSARMARVLQAYPGLRQVPFEPEKDAANAAANENSAASAPPRAFDLAGQPGAGLNITPELRAKAAAYITGKQASSPFELHLDAFAQDPVGAVAQMAKTIPLADVKPVDVTRMNAYSLNLSPDEVVSQLRPRFPSDEMFDAAAMAVKSAGAQFWQAARKATAPDAAPEDMEQAVRAYALTNQYVGAVRDAKTDWGRAGRIQQEMAGSFGDFDRAIHDIIAAVRPDAGPSDIEQVVRRVAQLDEPGKAPSFVSSLRWMGTKDGLLYGWYNWLLSNPAVVKAKIASDFITAGINVGDTYMAEKFGSGAVKAGETSQLVAGYLGSFSDALRAARKGLLAGQSQFLGDSRTLDGLQRGRVTALANGMDAAPEIAPEAQATIQAMRFVRAGLPTSWMGAADDFGKTFNYRAIARQLLYRQGVEKGLGGEALSNHVVEGLNNIPQDIHAQAVEGALRNTFTEAMSPSAQALQDWADKLAINIKGLKVPIPLGRVIAPFMRIGANATRMAYLHSPLPLVLPSGGFQAAVAAGGASRDLAYAKIGLGTGVAAIGALLASGAVPGLRMTGRGPSDPEMFKAWRNAGNQPYHIYVGDRGFQMPLEPLATGLGAIADSADILRYAHDQDAEQIAWSAVFGIGSAMTSRSYNQGIANLLEALHDPEESAERYGNNLISSMTMPPIALSLKNTIDPWARAHYGLLDAIAARTPGLSSSLPPQRNLWGTPIRVEDGLLPGAAGRLFAKVHTSSDLAEPVDRWIWDHRQAFPESDVGRLGLNAPGLIQSFSDPGSRGVNAQIRLTPQQLDRLKVLAGNELKGPDGLGAKDTFNALIAGNYPNAALQARWNDASDAGKALLMTSLWNKFRAGAKAQLLHDSPDIQQVVGQGLAQRAQQLKPAAAPPTLGAGP